MLECLCLHSASDVSLSTVQRGFLKVETKGPGSVRMGNIVPVVEIANRRGSRSVFNLSINILFVFH